MPAAGFMEAFCLPLLSTGMLLNPQSTEYDAGPKGVDSSSLAKLSEVSRPRVFFMKSFWNNP